MAKTLFYSVLVLFFFLHSNLTFSQTVDAKYLNPKHHTAGAYKFLRFGDVSNYYSGFMWNEGNASYGDGDDFSIFTYSNRDITLRTGTGNFIVFPSSGGNMGIGTTNPVSKLSIYAADGTATYPTNSTRGDVFQTIRSNNNGLEFGNSGGINDRKAWILARHASVPSYGKYFSTLHLQPDIGDKSQFRGVAIGYPASTTVPVGTYLAIEGDVGIGTTTPDSKLTVNGNIHAKEVKVDLAVPGPDYVFKAGYDLRTLEETQNYIKEHGHLPNIPSAKEMEKNGVELGIMNMKLLEKIEELTLYILDQQKQLDKKDLKILLLEERMNKIEQFVNQK